MDDEFIQACKNLNIEPEYVGTHILNEVKKELETIADEDDTTIEQFLRDMIDDYIQCRGQ